jgi:uncharacterized protein (TIGR03083 family)
MSTETSAETAETAETPAETDDRGAAGGIGPLEGTLRETLDVCAGLTADEWEAPSACEGWTVRTAFAHVTLGVAAIAGLLSLDAYDQGEDFESAVDLRARELAVRPAAELLELFRSSVPAVLGTFGALPDEVAAMPVNMASAGTYPFASITDALTFDQTCHIRWDILSPRGPVRRELPDLDAARLSASIRWLVRGIPQMTTTRFRELLTEPVTVVLTGPGATAFHVVPGPDGVVAGPDGAAGPDRVAEARATVHTTATDFILWGTGREPRAGRARIDGDTAYATRVLDEFRVF